jgi:hypothetical protein
LFFAIVFFSGTVTGLMLALARCMSVRERVREQFRQELQQMVENTAPVPVSASPRRRGCA